MSKDKEELISYIKDQNKEIEISMKQKDQQKLEIDKAIDQQKVDIDYFYEQKTLCDTDIEIYKANIEKNNQIIAIIEASG